jgi:hypothetical protein
MLESGIGESGRNSAGKSRAGLFKSLITREICRGSSCYHKLLTNVTNINNVRVFVNLFLLKAADIKREKKSRKDDTDRRAIA